MKFATLQLLLLVLLMGCATKYNPPDASKIAADTKIVRKDLTDASKNAKETKIVIKEAQEATEKIIQLSHSGVERVDSIIHLAPSFLKPELLILKADMLEQKKEEAVLVLKLASAMEKEVTQDATLIHAQEYELQLENHQQDYQDEAAKLAKIATSQSENLAWYRRHWWGSWIVFGLGVAVCILFFVLKILGKFAI
jgi:hypothetical protein